VVLLGGDGPSTRIVYHALRREFSPLHVILEAGVPRGQLLRRRVKKLGPLTVAGQLLFMGAILPRLRRKGARRIEEILRRHGMDDAPIDAPVHRVPSVNSEEARALLREIGPTVVVVNGTRIIGRKTLEAVPARFINMHAGITPLYRGVHGGYWALAEGRPELVGTTVHFVDEGIDTGTIIRQATFTVGPEDSFVTYPYLHTAAGLPILADAVRAALQGTLRAREGAAELPSRLRSHPTLWGYLHRRVSAGAR
jgi:folate-dependent phosphoribosylglycinamide formyltransferase PurN